MRKTPAFITALVIMLGLIVPVVSADQWSEPDGYYSSATGSGSTLKNQLQTIMSSGHIQRSYGDFCYSSKIYDADPARSGYIILCYNYASVSGSWDSGNTWNREHVWPQSRQPGSASNGTSGNLGDPHSLRPSDPVINSTRGNKPYSGINQTGSYGSNGEFYFPGDRDKGNIARSLFYSSTRYSLTLVNGTPSGYEMGDLASLLRWHYMDPPDEFERIRNHKIYSKTYNPTYYTNNRNAYVDHPEFVWSVFGGNDNDTNICVGETVNNDGTSEIVTSLDYEENTQFTFTINKSGADGTYYQIEVSGDLVCSESGKFAFDYGQQSKTITVSLNGQPSVTQGSIAGEIRIINLDVCSNSPQGCGGKDGDDIVTVYYSEPDTGLPGDINNDGWVDINDLSVMASDWLNTFSNECPDSDIAGEDCIINNLDFAVLASAWGSSIYSVVPDVTGYTVANAITELENNGLLAEQISVYSDTISAGLIVSSDPAADAIVNPGTTVTIYISMGSEPDYTATVPNLVSTLYTNAETTLTNLNLTLGNVTETYSDTVPEGYIISQTPAAGIVTDYYTAVNLVVSRGTEPEPGDGFVIITGVLDGDLSGGSPKCAELYVNGTVDLSSYSIRNYNNGSTTVKNTQALSGTYTNEFVYVVVSDHVSYFTDCFGSSGNFANVISGVAPEVNGDDCVALFHDTEMIDVYGQIGVDGSGKDWEQTDGYAIRNNGERPTTTFNASDWEVEKNGVNGMDESEIGLAVPFGEYQP